MKMKKSKGKHLDLFMEISKIHSEERSILVSSFVASLPQPQQNL